MTKRKSDEIDLRGLDRSVDKACRTIDFLRKENERLKKEIEHLLNKDDRYDDGYEVGYQDAVDEMEEDHA